MGDEVKKMIGANIVKARESRGLKAAQLSRLTSGQVSPSRLRNYESGEREPDMQTLILLAKSMKGTVNELLDGILEKNGPAKLYKADRLDIYDEIEALPASRLNEVRLAIEIVKSRIPRKPAPVIPMVPAGRKEKQKK
jgi:transcriptional regulator with XRE-family HTH domain